MTYMFSEKHMRALYVGTGSQVATLLDYFVVCSKKHQEVSQLPQGRDSY